MILSTELFLVTGLHSILFSIGLHPYSFMVLTCQGNNNIEVKMTIFSF